MIPSRAVRDARLSPSDLRVLLAMGTHADWAGRNIWASSRTMMEEARVTRTSYFRSVKRLIALGYLTAAPRRAEDGRQLTTMYAILHDEPDEVRLPEPSPPVTVTRTDAPVTVSPAVEVEEGEGAKPVALPRAKAVGRRGAKAMAPKQPKEQPKKQKKEKKKKPSSPALLRPSQGEADVMARIWRVYPKRQNPPHDFVRARRNIVGHLRSGVEPFALEDAADAYAEECQRQGTQSQYVKGMHNFFDEMWREYARPVTVDGLTREQWIRARKDVAEFDRLAGPAPEPDVLGFEEPDPLVMAEDALDL
jgi:hypothetical protein